MARKACALRARHDCLHPCLRRPLERGSTERRRLILDDYMLGISVVAMMSSQILSLSHLAISCAATPSPPGEGLGERCKKTMARPKGTGSASHTRILTEGGLPRRQLRPPHIGGGSVGVDVSFSSFLCAREKDKRVSRAEALPKVTRYHRLRRQILKSPPA